MTEQAPKQELGKEQPLSLLENFEACFDAVRSIESEWSDAINDESFQSLRQKMTQARDFLIQRLEDKKAKGEKIYSRVALSGFEGIDGFNRYEIMPDGSIVLSRSHSIPACIKKAEELGIRISEY